jgi:hypothetical protein
MLDIILLSTGVYCVAIFLLGSLVGRCISTSELEEYEGQITRDAYLRLAAETPKVRPNTRNWFGHAALDERQPMPSTEDLMALAAGAEKPRRNPVFAESSRS